MAVYSLETSALVKRYAQETGTAWIQAPAEALLNPAACSATLADEDLFLHTA